MASTPPAAFHADEDDDSSTDYTPALPPHLAAARAKPAPSVPVPPRRVIGPAALPGTDAPLDSDSDSDVGPQPLPASTAVSSSRRSPSGVEEFLAHEARRKAAAEEDVQTKPVRESWMLVPPSRGDLAATLDPTKLKARQFSRSTRPAGPDTPGSLWTETPAERQQRLADEISGRKRPAIAAASANEDEDVEARAKKQRRLRHDEKIRRDVEEHTRKVRGGALVDAHRHVDKPDDDESTAWDRDRDMGHTRLLGDGERRKLIREARDLSGRFEKSSRGSFL